MESCFPPLAGLSLRGSSSSKKHKNRHSLGGDLNDDKSAQQLPPNRYQPSSAAGTVRGGNNGLTCHTDYLPKLEVLQDLDLYYIRQIASSLKVRPSFNQFYLFFFFYIK